MTMAIVDKMDPRVNKWSDARGKLHFAASRVIPETMESVPDTWADISSDPTRQDQDASFTGVRLGSPVLSLERDSGHVMGYRLTILEDQERRDGTHFKVG